MREVRHLHGVRHVQPGHLDDLRRQRLPLLPAHTPEGAIAQALLERAPPLQQPCVAGLDAEGSQPGVLLLVHHVVEDDVRLVAHRPGLPHAQQPQLSLLRHLQAKLLQQLSPRCMLRALALVEAAARESELAGIAHGHELAFRTAQVVDHLALAHEHLPAGAELGSTARPKDQRVTHPSAAPGLRCGCVASKCRERKMTRRRMVARPAPYAGDGGAVDD
mmetsp:Transcript_32115/g.92311  ORF Transcript_32115/g.92311 Transcript_32115/m.92311 type:complete len:219 (-) Transcript_32115:101-757(-)